MGAIAGIPRGQALARKSRCNAQSRQHYCDKGDFVPPSTNSASSSAWIPVGSRVTAAWPGAQSKRQYESAIVELRAAILQDPTSSDEHRYLGQALLLLRRSRRRCVNANRGSARSDSSLAHHYLGTALFNGEDFKAAETEFARPCGLQPTADNHYYLAAC